MSNLAVLSLKNRALIALITIVAAIFGVPGQRHVDVGPQLTQQWQHRVANACARILAREIVFVDDEIVDPQRRQRMPQLCLAQPQQWANSPRTVGALVDDGHRPASASAAKAQQVQQQAFHDVVCVVGGDHGVQPMPSGHVVERPIARAAQGGFVAVGYPHHLHLANHAQRCRPRDDGFGFGCGAGTLPVIHADDDAGEVGGFVRPADKGLKQRP